MRGRGEGRGVGLGSGRSPGRSPGLPWEWAQADAGTALTPRLPFQVLLHVLFEHAVGYALLALKEVEEISLLQPQVGGSRRAAAAPACTARSHVACRALGCAVSPKAAE